MGSSMMGTPTSGIPCLASQRMMWGCCFHEQLIVGLYNMNTCITCMNTHITHMNTCIIHMDACTVCLDDSMATFDA